LVEREEEGRAACSFFFWVWIKIQTLLEGAPVHTRVKPAEPAGVADRQSTIRGSAISILARLLI
jgi:hypothetical protein